MHLTAILRFIVFSLLLSAQIFAQNWREDIFLIKNDTLHYQFIQSESNTETSKLPLLIFLHGSGERGNDNLLQLTHGGDLFLDAIQKEEIEGMVVFPQCPKEDYWAKVEKVLHKNDSLSFTFYPDSLPTRSMSLLIGLLDSLTQLSYIDPHRIYIGGLSMGGMGTFELLSRRPDLFAAAFPICGGGNPDAVKWFNPATKIWVFHGTDDKIVIPEYSEKMVIKMQSKGMKVRFTLYPETGHNAWDKTFNEPDLLPWIFSQHKN